MLQDLSFTICNDCDRSWAEMPRRTVTQRLRAVLRPLFEPTKHRGQAARLARYSATSPGGSRITTQDLSYFLNDASGRSGLTLDDLDDLAIFTGLSISALLDMPTRSTLTGEEEQLLLAYRGLSPEMRPHVLSVVDQRPVVQHQHLRRMKLKPPDRRIDEVQLREHDFSSGAAHGVAGTTAAESDPGLSGTLRELKRFIDAALGLEGEDPRGQVAGTGTEIP